MLDKFLEVSYAHQQGRNLRNEMAEAMTFLPTEMLHKLASGEEKLACVGEGGHWLDQFSGTPLYEQAIQLEEESIKLRAQRQTQSREDNDQRDQINDAEDAIRLKKKMLELDMRKQEAGVGGGEGAGEVAESPAEGMEAPPEEAMKEGSALRSLLVASMRKEAHEKTAAEGPAEGIGQTITGGLGGLAGYGLAKSLTGAGGTPKEKALRMALRAGGAFAGVGAGGAVGKEVGKSLDWAIKREKGKEKKSSVDPHLIASMRMEKAAQSPVSSKEVADQWGRQMAHMEKEAFGALAKGVWEGAKAVGKAGKTGWKGVAKAGQKIPGGMGPVQQVKGLRGAAQQAGGAFKKLDPKTQMALAAGGAGAAGLAGGAALS